MDFLFLLNSVLLGAALAMDAFSVSLVNGMVRPDMGAGGIGGIAGTFAFFQWGMPMLGWVCVYYFVESFTAVRPLIPYVALALLLLIGGKMIVDGASGKAKREKEEEVRAMKSGAGISVGALLLQGVATSIDALSTGFTFVGGGYAFGKAMLASLIIAAVTFALCFAGVLLGKKCGTRLAGRAGVLGGAILICIGIEIFIKGVFLA